MHWLTCGRFGSPAAAATVDDENLIERGSVQSESVSLGKKKTGGPMVGLEQGNSGLINYGGSAMNLSTTTCGLVILHTEDSQAVGYHWPFCQESSTYAGAFETAIGSRVGTGIEVVVNGGRYRSGDSAPAAFGRYLFKTYKLPVTVYRQVVDEDERRSDVDPWVQVNRNGVAPPVNSYALVPVEL